MLISYEIQFSNFDSLIYYVTHSLLVVTFFLGDQLKMFLLDWKKNNLLVSKKCLKEMANMIKMEKINFHRSKAQKKFLNVAIYLSC